MPTRVKALGEVALRVNDLDESVRFYREVVGLELMRRFDRAAFFRIADGHAGHTTVLALFDRQVVVEQTRTTLDHVAFAIALEDLQPERQRLEQLGLQVVTAVHEWVCWRSLYVTDPDGNEVEFVCYDPELVGH